MRLINADELRAEFPMPKDMLDPNQALVHITGIWAEIDSAPTIEERKTGKWEIYVISPFDGEGCRCSECKYEGAPYWDFCPNCGCFNGENNNGNE